MSAKVPFTKMAAAGNDFVLVDARHRRFGCLTRRWAGVARALCDRLAGIGADGMLVLGPSRVADVRMRIFNPDGSEASMCGNGARCVAWYLARRRHPPRRSREADRGKQAVAIDTNAGIVSARVRGSRAAVSLTPPTDVRPHLALAVEGRILRGTYINTGVPHLVVPVTALDRVDVNRLGRALRFHRAFAPQGTNVDFIQSDGPRGRLRVRTYERGVEAETLACGTGAAASAIVHGLRQASGFGRRTRGRGGKHRVTVATRSGERLAVSFAAVVNGGGLRVTDVRLEGEARWIYDGIVRWPLEGRS